MSSSPPPDDDRTVILAPEPSPASHNALPPGTRLGEFEIVGLIGEGGFGIVYLAYDSSLERKVALKEYMPSELAQRQGGTTVAVKSQRHSETFAAGLRSFINEARLLAQFDHPSLVKVYRFWEANGTAYMVMPYYEGVTLKEALRQRAAPPDESWLKSLLAQLLDALQVIHSRQCYHRDIAPDNILMLRDHTPLLLDFGAARRVIGDMTQALTVILKPGYAPIEQYAEAANMKQGPWTDLYALASVIYFAITGKAPMPAVARVMSDPLVPTSQAAAGRYSETFLKGIDAALAVKPEDRPQNVAEFRRALGLGDWHAPLHSADRGTEAAASARAAATTATPASSASAARKRRIPVYAAAGAGVLLIAVLAIGLIQWLSRPQPPSGTVATNVPAKTAAPASVEQPGDITAQLNATLGRFDCARLAGNTQQGIAVVEGHVSSDPDLQRLRSDIGQIKGIRTVDTRAVRVFPPPYCNVVSLLAPYADFRTDGPRIGLEGGATSLMEGRKLVTDVVAADFPGYVYADLYDVSGNVAHMLPNSKDNKNYAEARQQFVVGERGMQWDIVPPLGKHLLVVITSASPLFKHKRRDDVEEGAPYLDALKGALAARSADDRVAVSYTLVEFVPKR